MFVRVKDVDHPDEEMLSVYREHGVVRKDSRSDNFNKTAENRSIYQLVGPGWLLVNRMKAWQGSLGISPYRGIVSGHYLCFRPNHGEDPRFLNFLLRSQAYTAELNRLSRGVRPNQIEIDNDWLRVLPIFLPPLRQQQRIADFLDTEIQRLDSLVAKKRQIIALASARVAAAADEVLVESCPLPRRVRFLTSKIGSGSTPRGGAEAYLDEGIAFLRSQNIRDGRVNRDGVAYISEFDDHLLRESRVRPGDVLLNITGGSIGRSAVASDRDLPANVSQHVCIVRPSPSVDAVLLQAALGTSRTQEQIRLMQVGGNREGLNFDQVGSLEVHVRPGENPSVRQKLLDIWSIHRSVIARLEEQVRLLSEHRQAVIAAAVSGQSILGEVA